MKKIYFALLLAFACNPADMDGAEAFAEKHFPGYKDLECMNRDSDDDGYVSCTVIDANGTNQGIECAAKYSCNDGCRLMKMR